MYKNNATAEAVPKIKRQNSIPKKNPQTQPASYPRKLVIPKAVKLKLIGAGFCAFALAIATIAHFAVVNQLNSQISSMENELEKLNNQNTQLEMKTVELRSHQRIEQFAKEELGMERPKQTDFDYSNRNDMY